MLYLADIQHFVGSAQPARCGSAHLDVILSGRFAHKHRVEGGHLVHAHVRQAQDVGHLVHGRQWQPTVLALGKIQQRNHRTTLVTLRIDVQDGFRSLQLTTRERRWFNPRPGSTLLFGFGAWHYLLVVCGKLERNAGIILGRIAMHEQVVAHLHRRRARRPGSPESLQTTNRLSEALR